MAKCQLNKTRCNDMQRRMSIEKMTENRSLVAYWDTKKQDGEIIYLGIM
jgi:hypothetical protein